jgi:hypothetical protein
MAWDVQIYFRYERRLVADFYRPKKSIPLAAFEPRNLGSNGKHANHYTTEVTYLCFLYVVAALDRVLLLRGQMGWLVIK